MTTRKPPSKVTGNVGKEIGELQTAVKELQEEFKEFKNSKEANKATDSEETTNPFTSDEPQPATSPYGTPNEKLVVDGEAVVVNDEGDVLREHATGMEDDSKEDSEHDSEEDSEDDDEDDEDDDETEEDEKDDRSWGFKGSRY